MKMKMIGRKTCAYYIFVGTLVISAVTAVSTDSQVLKLSADGLDESEPSTTTTTTPVTATVSEFSSRLGVNGFKPSVDYARFAEQRASASSKNSSKIKFTTGEEVRTKKHVRTNKPPPASLKLYDSQRDQYNSSSTDQVETEESLPKHPRIYYGDLSHSKQYPLRDDPQINNIETDLKEHSPHHHQHENHNYGDGEKRAEDQHPKYYFPKSLLAKDEPQGHPSDYGHGQHHDEHPLVVDDIKVNYAHPHGYGYGYPDHHAEHHDHAHQHDHNHHSHAHGHSFKYTDHLKGHGLEGAVGKAFHLLIPSALFLGGISALFPNRVHVPTTDIKYRQKRAISYQAGSSDPAEFEDIPAKYLKREHRSDDTGIELDLDEGENPFLLPNIRPPLSSTGGRNGHRDYNNARLTPHQRFELSPPTTQRTPAGLRPRHRHRPSGQNNRAIPEQYDAFFFNNPGSYNFDVPPPTYSPDNEPSPIPPTFPTNRLQPTEEMVSEEEFSPPKEKTTTTAKPKTKKNKNRSRNIIRPQEEHHFVPIPIEEPVLDVIPDTTDETDVEEPETSTTKPPAKKTKSTGSKSNGDANTGSNKNREAREQMDREIINPLQSLNSITSPDEITKNEEKDKKKEVDLSPDGPVIGLLSSYAVHDKDSPECQKKALCQLAMKGATPVATKFESFLWNLANLVPDQFSQLYDLEEIFNSIRKKDCNKFLCNSPNLDIQE